jgi:hypothetical protein
MSKAVAHEDFVPVHDLIRFAPGETTKVSQYNLKLSNFKNLLKFTEIQKCYISILNDGAEPVMEGMKLLQVQIKPILKSEHVLSENELCHLIDPDVVSVLIDDTIEDSKP